MDNEFNSLNYDNIKTTFTGDTNNSYSEDVLLMDPIYQVNTKVEQRKKVSKTVNIVGISLAFTATAIAGGAVLTNVFIQNPPTVSNVSTKVDGDTFYYEFSITNKKGYKVTYTIELNDKVVSSDVVSSSKHYSFTYSPVSNGDKIYFHIDFTNSIDYHKVIHQTTYIVGGISQ